MTSVLEKFLFEQMMVLKDNTGKTVFELWLTKKRQNTQNDRAGREL